MGKKKDRSPLKTKPLRLAGQSLDERIVDFLLDHVMLPLMLVVVLWVFAGVEWYRYLYPHEPSPGAFTAMATGVSLYVAWRLRHMYRQVQALRQGRDGERSVGEFLERLRGQGYRVFHDIVGDGWNIDHVLIGPAGVFTIETKTISKPRRGDARIFFRNGKVLVRDHEMDRDPIPQAKAQASWLRQHFEQAGLKAEIRPVVVFPGWFVDSSLHDATGVWVLEPKAFAKVLLKGAEKLTAEQCGALATALSAYIRSHEPGRGT